MISRDDRLHEERQRSMDAKRRFIDVETELFNKF